MLLATWRNLGGWLALWSSQRRRRDAGRQSLIQRVGVEILEERSLLSSGLPQQPALGLLPAGPVQVLESPAAQNALKGKSTTFRLGSFTDSGPADGPWAVDVIWGDGTPDSTFVRTSTGSLGDLAHTFTGGIKTGLGPNGFDPTANFWVTVNVTNQHGDAGTGVFPVAITNAPHVVESSVPQPTLKGKATTFQLGSFTDSDPANGPWAVDVNWNDGSPDATFMRTAPGSLGSLAHTYTGINPGPLAGSPGNPVATVRVTNEHGDVGIGLLSVAITNIPQVSEPLASQNALKGVATTLQLGSFTDSDPTDKPWTVDINWGDGSADSVFTRTATGSLGDLGHTYTTAGPGGTAPLLFGAAGNFWVTVRVTNGHSDFGTSGFGVNLTNVPHVVEPIQLQNALQSKATVLHLGSFTDTTASDGPWVVDVNWGDSAPDSTFTLTSAGSLGTLSHTYTGLGIYPPGSTGFYLGTVTVTNRHGDAGAGRLPITITNIPHVVEPLDPQNALKDVATTFQLGSFTDSDATDKPWTVDVNWGDGSPDSIFTRQTPGSLGTLSHTYTKGPLETYGPNGNYGVTVIVTNGHGDFSSAGFEVNLTNVPHLVGPLQLQSALKGQATTFHLGSFTDSNPADGPWTVDVNWGDGSPDSTFTRAAVGSLGDLAHTYPTASQASFGPPGTYNVGIRITNRHGDLGIGNFQVTITNIPRVNTPLGPQSAMAGKSTTFQLGSFTDAGATDGPWTVDVNWGDGSPDNTFTRGSPGALGQLAHTYADANSPFLGIPTTTFHLVSIRLTNQHGDFGTGSFSVDITNVPHVYAPAVQNAQKGKATTFQLGSFTDADPADGPWKVVVHWNDGSPDNTFTLTSVGYLGSLAHTYPAAPTPGVLTYTALVTVTNRHGDFGTGGISVNITNIPRVSELFVPQPGLKGKSATFHLGSFTDSDPADGPWTVDVNWGDGSADSILTRTAAGSLGDLAHTFSALGIGSFYGSYNVSVHVTNRHGDAGGGSFPVTITNVPRVLESILPQPALRNQVTTFHLGSFTDSDPADGPWQVDVNWGDGSPDSKFTRAAAGSLGDLSHTYANPSPLPFPMTFHGVTVKVTNQHGDYGIGNFQVAITNVPQVTEPFQPQGALRGTATTLHLGSFTDSGTADGPWQVDVNWGDGSPDSKFTRTAPGPLGDLSHTYANLSPVPSFPTGNYVVMVKVTNRNGDVGTGTFSVTITNVPHVMEPLAPQTATSGTAATIQLGSFTDAGASDGPWKVDVNWGDFTPDSTCTRTATGSLGSLVHLYFGNSTYEVTVRVSNQRGDVGVDNFFVTVATPIIGAHAVEPSAAAQPSTPAANYPYFEGQWFRNAPDADLTLHLAQLEEETPNKAALPKVQWGETV